MDGSILEALSIELFNSSFEVLASFEFNEAGFEVSIYLPDPGEECTLCHHVRAQSPNRQHRVGQNSERNL